jgi:hypothetical protein
MESEVLVQGNGIASTAGESACALLNAPKGSQACGAHKCALRSVRVPIPQALGTSWLYIP